MYTLYVYLKREHTHTYVCVMPLSSQWLGPQICTMLAGDWTQGFVHVQQALFQLGYTPAPKIPSLYKQTSSSKLVCLFDLILGMQKAWALVPTWPITS